MPQSPYLPEDVADARCIVTRGHNALSALRATDAQEIRATAWSVLAENHAALHPRCTPTTPARIIPIPLAVFQMGRRRTSLQNPQRTHPGGDAA